MDKNTLKASDICRIIKECKGVGVSEFKYQDLHIKFSEHRNVQEDPQVQAGWAQLQLEDATPQLENPKQLKASVFDQQAVEDMYEAQLLIDDPAAFEHMMVHKDLETSNESEHP